MTNTPAQEQQDTSDASPQVQPSWLRGDYGLPATFWSSVVGSICLLFLFSTVINITEAEAVLWTFLIGFQLYSTLAVVASWRAASRYEGTGPWNALTKLVLLAWYALVSLVVLYVMAMLSSEYPNH